MKSVLALPIFFPEFPRIRPLISQLQKGEDGLWAMAVGPEISEEMTESTYAFFE